MTPGPLVAAAADYLTRGLSIIALTGKTPNVTVHRRGLKQPLTGEPESDEDWELLRSVFEHPDTTGVGILTSWPYVVVDIDGEEGAAQWAALIGEEPGGMVAHDGWCAATGRGLHLWFLTGQETGTIKLGSKLDLKGEGGYVAAPPSQHPDGPVYRWLIPPNEFLPPPVPEQLTTRIAYHVAQSEGVARSKAARKTIRGPRYEADAALIYPQYGYGAVIAGMATAGEGNRNNYLHWAAATLSEEGAVDEDFEELRAAALAAGLEPVEVKRTLRSARRADD